MNTIEKINSDAAEIAGRLKAGEKISDNDRKVLAIYNSLHGGKAGNAGKRNANKVNKQNIR